MAIGCFLILLLALGSLMVRVAPAWVDAPIASLSLSPSDRLALRIIGYDFVCTSQKVADNWIDRCTTSLQDRPLTMTLTHAKPFRAFETQGIACQANFAEKALPCEVWFDFATGNVPNVVIKDSLGLSLADLQALRQQNFLSQISDPQWNTMVFTLAIVAGSLTALSARFDLGWPIKIFAGISLSFLIWGVATIGLSRILYGLGGARYLNTSPGPEIISILPLVLGLGIGVATIRLFQSRSRLAQILIIVGSGCGAFSALFYLLLLSVLTLGFVD